MNVITYRIFLEQPLLATQIMGDPNSSVSFNYIPGSLIRGMLIHRYLQQHPELPEQETVHDATCRRLFFDGSTRYLHAYPLLKEGQRSLPLPRSFLRCKSTTEDTATVYNAAHEDFDREEAEEDGQLQPVGGAFCLLNGEDLSLCSPPLTRLTVHVQRDRKKGRATAKSGEVFQYEALSAGQWFGGVVLVDTVEDAATVSALFDGPVWLGRSRSAGYGKVLIEVEATDPGDTWREIEGVVPSLTENAAVTMTLLSDTILRDEDGMHARTLTTAILERYLGVKIADLDATRSFSALTVSGGFNRTAQTPLAQSYSLAAGSTVSFTLAQPLDKAEIIRLEARGIGERRTEGFGRIVLNWLETDSFAPGKAEPYQVRYRRNKLSPLSQALAQQMARRMLDQQLEEQIASFVRDHVEPHADQFPANSQLGRVRVFLRRAARTGAPLATILQALDTFQSAGRQQFERTRIDNTSLWNWLRELLADPPQRDVWQQIWPDQSTWPQVAGERAPVDAARTHAVTRQLIEATLTAAARKRKEARR